ncbi:MAG TPA: hypothetical protein VGC64_01135, partial [Pyrinomonadaceae bacterium]
YSLFEDAKESRVWARAGTHFGSLKTATGRRISKAYAGVAATIFPRRTKVDEPVSGKTAKDRYVDQASGD